MDTNIFKQKLEAERERLMGELSGIARQNETTGAWEALPPETDNADFRDEIADRLEEDEARGGLIEPLTARLGEVEKALERIAAGTYGTCEVGGEPIEEARLEANPAATTCTAHMPEEQLA